MYKKKTCVLDADSRVIYTHIDLDDGEFTAKQACMYKNLCVRCRPSCYLVDPEQFSKAALARALLPY